MYIPPAGLYFRLRARETGYVLYSRRSPTPQVWQYKGPEYEDQLFTLIYGTGERAGLYAIQGKASGYALYSRASPDPRVGHVVSDWDSNKYCWFSFQEGSGNEANYFRILCPGSEMVLYSRLNQKPDFGNYTQYGVHPDQYFSMVFEDMIVERVEYDVARGTIMGETAVVLANQTLKNDTDHEQEMSFSFSESINQTSTFEYSTGFTVTAGMEFSAGIPIVSEAKISVSVAHNQQWSFGTQNSYTKTYSASFPVKAGPHSTVRGVSTVQKGTLDVPFTMYLASKSTGVKVQTQGVWNGVSSWDLHHSISVADV
ncbi:hemolytic lectin LSLb [Armillaria mellea]|nr:hemolytic lectin LSLb [Armillaria mellea]